MTAGLWQPGTFITGRSIWYGRVFTSWPSSSSRIAAT